MKLIEPASEFTWGKVIQDFSIYPYTIRAFHPRKVKGSSLTDEIDLETTHYHGYVSGEDVCESWATIDEALAGLIVRRNIGPNNRQISQHFIAGISAIANE